MKVKVKRFFISAQHGNVDKGRILDVSEAHGQHYIQHGLADVYEENKPADPVKAVEPVKPDFTQSTKDSSNGSSLPAAQVSQPKTANVSKFGGKKAKKGK